MASSLPLVGLFPSTSMLITSCLEVSILPSSFTLVLPDPLLPDPLLPHPAILAIIREAITSATAFLPVTRFLIASSFFSCFSGFYVNPHQNTGESHIILFPWSAFDRAYCNAGDEIFLHKWIQKDDWSGCNNCCCHFQCVRWEICHTDICTCYRVFQCICCIDDLI